MGNRCRSMVKMREQMESRKLGSQVKRERYVPPLSSGTPIWISDWQGVGLFDLCSCNRSARCEFYSVQLSNSLT